MRRAKEENAMAKNDNVEDRAAVDEEGRNAEARKAGLASADKETAERIVHDTTTRERHATSVRAHEPLDAELADDDQPNEDENGPRAAAVTKK